METKHADEWEALRKRKERPTVPFNPPEGRPELSTFWYDDSDGDANEEDNNEDDGGQSGQSVFTRVLHLLRPLTSLVTRIHTSLDLEAADYDSDPEPEPQTSGEAHSHSETDSSPEESQKPPPSRIEHYPTQPTVLRVEESTPDQEALWYPFRSGYEFKLAKWMMDSNLSKAQIDAFFNKGLARVPPVNSDESEGTCFTSSYTLGNLLDGLDEDLNIDSWHRAAVDHYGTGLIEFRYRSLEKMIRHIFAQQSHEDYMVYMPYKEFDSATGYRIYSETASAQWWWHMQVHLPFSYCKLR